MNKKTIKLLVVALLTAVMIMPQQAVAKEKKVKYLGHVYKGEVNKKKIPEGHGVMNVGGLLIEGIFDDHSATDANVNIWNFHNSQFKGNIAYDGSDNITLKAGGVFITDYYEESWTYEDTNAKKIEKILEEDRVVNRNSFELNTIEIPCRTDISVDKSIIDRLINFPKVVLVPINLKKVAFRYSNLENSVEREIFICPKEIKKLNNYKDALGRIINYSSGIDFSVDYPNGDRFTWNDWEIHYPNGQIIKCSYGQTYEIGLNWGWIDLGDGLLVAADDKRESFWKYREMDEFHLTSPTSLSVCDRSFNKYTSSTDVEKIVKEKLTPYLENFNLNEHKVGIGYVDKPLSAADIKKIAGGNLTPDVENFLNEHKDDIGNVKDYSIQVWGRMENGKFISSVERQQAAKEQEAKEDQEAYEKLCKLYGKKYVDSWKKGVPAIGMPEGLLKSGFYNRLVYQSATSKTYYLLPWNGADDYRRLYTVYVNNGKVTSFRKHR